MPDYIKIHEYPLERLSFGDDDYYDVDYWDGTQYQSAKIKGSAIIANGGNVPPTVPTAAVAESASRATSVAVSNPSPKRTPIG